MKVVQVIGAFPGPRFEDVEDLDDDLDAALETVPDMVSSLRLDVDSRRGQVHEWA